MRAAMAAITELTSWLVFHPLEATMWPFGAVALTELPKLCAVPSAHSSWVPPTLIELMVRM